MLLEDGVVYRLETDHIKHTRTIAFGGEGMVYDGRHIVDTLWKGRIVSIRLVQQHEVANTFDIDMRGPLHTWVQDASTCTHQVLNTIQRDDEVYDICKTDRHAHLRIIDTYLDNPVAGSNHDPFVNWVSTLLYRFYTKRVLHQISTIPTADAFLLKNRAEIMLTQCG